LTLGRAVAGSAARAKARSIGREETKADRDAETPQLRVEHVTKPAFLLGREIRLLPNDDGELRAAEWSAGLYCGGRTIPCAQYETGI